DVPSIPPQRQEEETMETPTSPGAPALRPSQPASTPASGTPPSPGAPSLAGEWHLYQLENNTDLDDTGNARRLIDANKGNLLSTDLGWAVWIAERGLWVVGTQGERAAIRLATDAAALPLAWRQGLDEAEDPKEQQAIRAQNAKLDAWVSHSRNMRGLTATLNR